jgi:hypothetical protein
MKRFSIILICIIVFAIMCGCTVEINGHNVIETRGRDGGSSYAGGTDINVEESASTNLDGIEIIELSNDSGNIKILRTDKNEISVRAEKKLRGFNESKKGEILENMKLSLTKKGKTLEVDVLDKNGAGVWDWKKMNFKSLHLTIDYTIEIPDRINEYDLKDGAGNIKIQDLTGVLSISNGAGEIELENMVLKEKSDIHLGAGNIKVNADIKDAKELSINNGAGNISLKLPESSKFNLESSVGIGNLSGNLLGDTRVFIGSIEREINGGGAMLKVKTGIGNISIDKK